MQNSKVGNIRSVQVIEDAWYITSACPITKTHYISLVAFATDDRIHLIRQYPEWNFEVRIFERGHGMLIKKEN